MKKSVLPMRVLLKSNMKTSAELAVTCLNAIFWNLLFEGDEKLMVAALHLLASGIVP